MTLQASYNISQEAIQGLQQDTFSRYLLDSVTLIDSLKHFLRGEELVEEERKTGDSVVLIPVWRNVDGKKPPINEQGYNYTVQMLTPIMDKVISSSNFEPESASIHACAIMNEVTCTYYLNFIEFGFNSQPEMDTIIAVLLALVYSQFRRSVNMETLKQLFSKHETSEMHVYDKTKQQAPIPQMAV